MVAARSRKPPPPGLAEELGLLLAQARRLTWNRAAQRLEQRGDSVHAWQLLNHLHRLGPSSQRELATSVAQHPAGVSRMLEELEKQRWVVRRRAADDRRKLVVELTARGRAALMAMRPEVAASAEETLSRLTVAEQEILRGLLRKICEPARRG